MGKKSQFKSRLVSFFKKGDNPEKRNAEIANVSERYKNLFELSPEAGVVVNRMGYITDCNKALCELSGYAKNELVGKHFTKTKLFDTKRIPEYLSLFKKIYTRKKIDPVEFTWYHKDGRKRQGIAYISVIKKDGKYLGIQAITRDVTRERENARSVIENEIKYRSLFELVNDAIFLIKDGVIVDCNQKSLEIYNCNKSSLLGKSPDVLSPEYQPDGALSSDKSNKHIIEALDKGETFFEWVHRDCKGRNFHAEISLSKLQLNKETYLMSVVRDVTEKVEAARKIREREVLYRSIFENTGLATCIIEEDKTLYLVNDKFVKLAEKDREEIEGKIKWTDFVDPSEIERMSKYHLLRREKSSTPDNYEFDFITGKKNYRRIQLKVNLIPNTKRSVASLLDITKTREIEEKLKISEEKFRVITNSAQDAIVLISEQALVSYWNPASVNIFGYTPDEMIGKNFFNVIISKEKKNALNIGLKEFKELFCQGKKLNELVEFEATCKNGQKIILELSISPVSIAGELHYIALGRDISERIKNRNELIKAKEKAEESDRLKSAFLATMSHELRTPLNSIIGFSEILSEFPLEDKLRTFTETIHKNGLNLLSIIEDIFDLAMLDIKNISLRNESIQIKELFKLNKSFLEELLSVSNKSSRIKLVFKEHAEWHNESIVLDKQKFNQVFTNLFKNAVKFTDKGKIEFGYVVNKENFISFYVKDTGVGIPEQKQQLIFETFRQGDETHTRKHGGVGIGLAISKILTEKMGGNLILESKELEGSCFTFELPLKGVEISEVPAQKQEEVKPKNKTKKNVMIVEDDSSNMLLIENIINDYPIQIIKAQNGEIAVEKVKEEAPDLIFMDLKMPVMDGFAASAEIIKLFPEMNIIALSAYVFEEDKRKAKESGCRDYLTKPVKSGEIRKMMNKYLS